MLTVHVNSTKGLKVPCPDFKHSAATDDDKIK